MVENSDWRELTPAEVGALQPFTLDAADLSADARALLREAEAALTKVAMQAIVAGSNIRRKFRADDDAQAAVQAEVEATGAAVVAWLNTHLVPLLPRETTQ